MIDPISGLPAAPMITDPGGVASTAVWDTYPGPSLEEFVGDLANDFQDLATVFSIAGATFELGGLIGGCVAGGLPGCAVGLASGHILHIAITNPFETGLSYISAALTVVHSSMIDEFKIEINQEGITMKIDEATANTIVTGIIGEKSTWGIEDALIDIYGSAYNHGNAKGVYWIYDYLFPDYSDKYPAHTE